MGTSMSDFLKTVWLLVHKDLMNEFRNPYAVTTLLFFVIIVLSAVGMSLGGVPLEPQIASVFLWVLLFFCSIAGLSRSFVQEQESGTLFLLWLCFQPQPVLLGKFFLNLLLMVVVTVFVFFLFPVF